MPTIRLNRETLSSKLPPSPARKVAALSVVFALALALVPALIGAARGGNGHRRASDPGSGGGGAATTRAWAQDAAAVSSPSTTWYLAEGCTASGFETWVLVQNPNAYPAAVRLTFMTDAGPSAGPSFELAALSRKSINIADSLPGAAGVSTVVQSTSPVVVERAMYGSARRWATGTAGVTAPSTTWYLAEGCTAPGFETWVLVQNPGTQAAMVTLGYMTSAGKRAGPSFRLGPSSRKTVNVADVAPGQWDVSTSVESDRPVVVERSMYGGGREWAEGSAGATGPASTWYLAEGCTAGGAQTWVLVQNPGTRNALVNLTYMTPAGPVKGQSQWLAPGSRRTFLANDVVPDKWDVSTIVQSASPVVVERSVLGPGRQWASGAGGVKQPGTDWFLAEGSTGPGFETWVLVQNPTALAAHVSLTCLTGKGERAGPSFQLAPFTRRTVNLADFIPGEWDVSTRVRSDHPVVVERAMYGDRKSSVTELTLMKGSTFETPAYVMTPGGGSSGVPTLMVIGGMHGDEDAGYNTAGRLTRAVVSRGKLVVVPSANQPAIARHTREVNKDLNRCFPGVEHAAAEDGLAWEIMDLARANDVDLLLNLHAAYQFIHVDPSGMGQTFVFDDGALTGLGGQAAGQANLSIGDWVEQFSLLLRPIPSSVTYEVFYRQGKPAFGIEACVLLDLGRQVRDQMLAIRAFAEQAGLVIDNWDELLR
jgi:hypothetical protein